MGKLTIKNRYSTTPNEISNNKNLSFKAKGLWTYIQSKPDGWNFSSKRICMDSNEGESAIKAGLKELEKYGYLKRTPVKENGLFAGYDYELIEKPLADYPLAENQLTDNPLTGNIPTLSNKDNSNKDNSKPGVCNSENEKFTPPENLPYPEMLKQNEGSGYFDRKPKIPTKAEVWEVFQRMGGTVEQAKAFWESNEGTGWFYKGSPIVNFTTLANRFIANWRQIAQRNAKPKQNEPPKRKTQTAQDLLKERGLI